MKLFIANNQQVYDSLIAATTDLADTKYSSSASLRFWINGKKTVNGWKTYDPLENSLYPNAVWYLGDSNFGSCLTIYMSTIWSTPAYAGTDCGFAFDFFCEYN